MTIKNRIDDIERRIKAKNNSKFTVIYRDGRTKKIEPKDAIDIVKDEADEIERIEAHNSDTAENGILCELVNALLV